MKAVNTNFHRISVNGVFVYTHENKQLLSATFDSKDTSRFVSYDE